MMECIKASHITEKASLCCAAWRNILFRTLKQLVSPVKQSVSARETNARRQILTCDEEGCITDKHGTIEMTPEWRWILELPFE